MCYRVSAAFYYCKIYQIRVLLKEAYESFLCNNGLGWISWFRRFIVDRI